MRKQKLNFFTVIIQRQTYLNLLYLLFSFPLGIFYFVILTSGISLGLGMLITLFGIPILFGILLLWRVFAKFEIILTTTLLDIKISPISKKKSKKFWDKIYSNLNDSFTWKSLAYLFIKFPLGIISFVLLITLLSISLSLIVSPILYHLIEIGVIQGVFCNGSNVLCSLINSYLGVSIVGAIGILSLFAFLHFLNELSYISALLAKVLLGKK